MNKKLTVWVVGGLLAFTVVGYNFFGGSVAKAAEETPAMGMQSSMMQDGKMMNSEEMQENMKGMMKNTSFKETASTEDSSTDNMDHGAHHLGQD